MAFEQAEIGVVVAAVVVGTYEFLKSIIMKLLPNRAELSTDEHGWLKTLHDKSIRNDAVLKNLEKTAEANAKCSNELLELIKEIRRFSKANGSN